MCGEENYNHILIRDATVLVRILTAEEKAGALDEVAFFDVRTGVRVRGIHPPLQATELEVGYRLTAESAACIIGSGVAQGMGDLLNSSNVVSILDIRQRKLDSVVADSVLDQLRVIINLLQSYLRVAEDAHAEERLWLSQQVLGLVGKFSGREMTELEEIVEWFKTRPHK